MQRLTRLKVFARQGGYTELLFSEIDKGQL